MPPSRPLLSFNSPPHNDADSFEAEPTTPTKTWIHYLPLILLIIFMLAPHPSLLIILVNHYLRYLEAPITFTIHLVLLYTLAGLSFTSLIVCVVRDPGPVVSPKYSAAAQDESGVSGGDELGLTEALMGMGMGEDDEIVPGKWCRKCWAPKPDRAHHCSICDRCVLKMDHHCPWLGSKCVGHRIYPAFVHFLACITLFAGYVTVVCCKALYFAFYSPMLVNDAVAVHELFLGFAGIVVTIVVGSFLVYHMYLITTNQTTLENLAPYVLLRHLPPLPASLRLSDPPQEHELSYNQRRAVQNAYKSVKMYDVGWKQNWAQVFGWSDARGCVMRICCGGASKGDGRTFMRNPGAVGMLSQLASDLATVDKTA
ncbi:zf-DHHC-domain-containing protein [Coniophora puteana RWD-64-598 SS2]|uniref:Palmitoyltransferase n=1 Tax=Coniophora puteana (strain RWD-64-598) TaxID=741705 RepID=R7SHY0_CONPW|nr:zf-DHHC-domain-containing protein [Coniophora puteana RWD-64-598 SS2]EIW74659.1 zf-DHHC-domain-containing protein [Coniophora puteana RWD-64-598 SS2]